MVLTPFQKDTTESGDATEVGWGRDSRAINQDQLTEELGAAIATTTDTEVAGLKAHEKVWRLNCTHIAALEAEIGRLRAGGSQSSSSHDDPATM